MRLENKKAFSDPKREQIVNINAVVVVIPHPQATPSCKLSELGAGEAEGVSSSIELARLGMASARVGLMQALELLKCGDWGSVGFGLLHVAFESEDEKVDDGSQEGQLKEALIE